MITIPLLYEKTPRKSVRQKQAFERRNAVNIRVRGPRMQKNDSANGGAIKPAKNENSIIADA